MLLTAQAFINLNQEKDAVLCYQKALDLNPNNAIAVTQLGILKDNAGQYADALKLFQKLNELSPEDDHGLLLTSSILDNLGKEKEAVEAFEKALKFSSNPDQLFNHRGERRRRNQMYEEALEDYYEALKLNPGNAYASLNLVSACLGMGRHQEALEHLDQAAQKIPRDEGNERILLDSFHENCLELFVHAPTRIFPLYLAPAMKIIDKAGLSDLFEQSLTLTVFALIQKHESISEDRFGFIVDAFQNNIGNKISTVTSVHFLRVGIEYFKKENQKALLKLTREERRVFCRQLGIEQ